MTVYFNPLEKACKSITGAISQTDTVHFNVFLLKNEVKEVSNLPEAVDCRFPEQNAFLHINVHFESPFPFLKIIAQMN